MLSHDQALDIMLAQVTRLGTISLPIADSLGFVTAQDVYCHSMVSPFDNSAMDGFAVRHAELGESLHEMNVVGSSFAGDTIVTGAAGAWEIMTGAGIPSGYDTVIKIEDVQILAADVDGRPTRIKIENKNIVLGSHIRQAGQDFMPDDLVIRANEIIHPAHISALATIGVAEISVFRKPTIAIIGTGKEIIDNPQQDLKSGQIRNSNGPHLLATLREMGYPASYAGTIHDGVDDYETCLKSLVGNYDIIISTGAVSMGRHDFIPESLANLGAEIKFHKCKIRPGKPVLYAKFEQQQTHYFGLPGNPISTSVAFRFFVSFLIDAMQNLPIEQAVKARLAIETDKPHGFKMFNKAFADIKLGVLEVNILQGQESFKIKPLLAANCWAVFEETQHKNRAGELVSIYPMLPRGGF